MTDAYGYRYSSPNYGSSKPPGSVPYGDKYGSSSSSSSRPSYSYDRPEPSPSSWSAPSSSSNGDGGSSWRSSSSSGSSSSSSSSGSSSYYSSGSSSAISEPGSNPAPVAVICLLSFLALVGWCWCIRKVFRCCREEKEHDATEAAEEPVVPVQYDHGPNHCYQHQQGDDQYYQHQQAYYYDSEPGSDYYYDDGDDPGYEDARFAYFGGRQDVDLPPPPAYSDVVQQDGQSGPAASS